MPSAKARSNGGAFGLSRAFLIQAGSRRIATVRKALQHHRREDQRHRGRRRHRACDRIVREIAADCAERGLAEHERRAAVDVGRVDPDARPPLTEQGREGRAFEQVGIEPGAKARVIVDAARDRARDVADADRGVQRLLGVTDQKALAKILQRRTPLQAEIRRRHCPTGDAGDKIDVVDERNALAAHRYVRLLHFLEHAERERGRAHAAAREREADQDVVLPGRRRAQHIGQPEARVGVGDRLVDRKVDDVTAAREQQQRRRSRGPTEKHLRPLPLRPDGSSLSVQGLRQVNGASYEDTRRFGHLRGARGFRLPTDLTLRRARRPAENDLPTSWSLRPAATTLCLWALGLIPSDS